MGYSLIIIIKTNIADGQCHTRENITGLILCNKIQQVVIMCNSKSCQIVLIKLIKCHGSEVKQNCFKENSSLFSSPPSPFFIISSSFPYSPTNFIILSYTTPPSFFILSSPPPSLPSSSSSSIKKDRGKNLTGLNLKGLTLILTFATLFPVTLQHNY